MSRRSLVATSALAAGMDALLAQAPADGQTQSAAPKPAVTGKPPLTPDGKPDLQGIWTDNTVTPFERPQHLGSKEFYTDQQLPNCPSARVREISAKKAILEPRTRRRSPEGVVPPMLPDARKRNADRVARNKGHEFDSHENRPLSERCILLNQERIPPIPGANEGILIQIVQGPGYVTILRETT